MMKRSSPAWRIFAILAVFALATPRPGATEPESLDRNLEYTVTDLRGKLVRESPDPTAKLKIGATAHSGEVLKAGWYSRAELSVVSHRARFKISARSRVRLAGDRPGVLLELEQGRIRAIFDHFEGDEPPERRVVTPSAILAVRGTEYGVSVSRAGITTVVVFAGVVEINTVIKTAGPVLVSAGQSCTVRPGQVPSTPQKHMMQRDDWDRGRAPGPMPGKTGSEQHPRQGGRESAPGGRMSGGGRG